MHIWKVRGWEARRSIHKVVGNGETISGSHGLDFVDYVRIPGKGRGSEFGERRDIEYILVVAVGDVYFPAFEF